MNFIKIQSVRAAIKLSETYVSQIIAKNIKGRYQQHSQEPMFGLLAQYIKEGTDTGETNLKKIKKD